MTDREIMHKLLDEILDSGNPVAIYTEFFPGVPVDMSDQVKQPSNCQKDDQAADSFSNALSESFAKANDANRNFFEKLPGMLENIRRQTVMAVGEKNLKIYSRYLNASFVTRWYWKRRLDKAMREFEAMHNDLDAKTKDHANH